jgi:hypothetical protein
LVVIVRAVIGAMVSKQLPPCRHRHIVHQAADHEVNSKSEQTLRIKT